MPDTLTDAEVRVLAALVEKQLTTPDQYPLSLNSLVAACNQKSNREPVVRYDEETVVRALDALRDRELAWESRLAGARVPKYEHGFDAAYRLAAPEVAVLCLLMLRGPQTLGELRGRSARLHPFDNLEEVEEALARLVHRAEQPLVCRLPRQPGQKEARYAQLLNGEPKLQINAPAPPPEAARQRVQAQDESVTELRAEVEALRTELTAMQSEFERFRKQFE